MDPSSLGCLAHSVDTFLGIAGGNLGLASCGSTGAVGPRCGSTNGFCRGYRVGLSVAGRSGYLDELLSASGNEGLFYSMWSRVDEVLGSGGFVHAQPTSRNPAQTDEVVFVSASYGHGGLKDETAAQQVGLVKDRQAN
jgi:hypothetical protein